MPRVGREPRQKDLYTQLREARTQEERDRIVRRLRHAEVGVEGERGRVLDGLIVNGRDPFADLRGGRVRTVYEDQPREAAEGRTERPMTVVIPEALPPDVEAVLSPETPAPEPDAMSITEAAERLGVKADKLRYLEQTGAIPPAARPNGRDRVYAEQDLAAIRAVLDRVPSLTPPTASAAKVPAREQQAPGRAARPPFLPKETRHEIIYCPDCRRQLSEKDYAVEVEDVVMTDHGGITRTLVTCFQHKVVAIKTEFVIRRPGAGS